MAVDRLDGKKTLNVGGFLDEFERDDIKKRVDIIMLFKEFGIHLEKKGKSYTGRCPWHDDKNPSLSVDREKGLYNCFGCGEAGDHFTLVMKMKNTDFKGALSFLKTMTGKAGTTIADTAENMKKEVKTSPKQGKIIQKDNKNTPSDTTVGTKPEKKEPPLLPDITLDTITDFYHKKLYENRAAFAYLTETRKINPGLIQRFRIGYADGSLLKMISNGQKETFKALGLLKTTDTGRMREFFTGCVTFPIFDDTGKTIHFYGRKASAVKSGPGQTHLYLSGSHKGIFNRKASKVYDEIILTESILDCLSLITMGFENTQALYGVGTLIAEHLQILKDDRVKTIILGFDADGAGRAGIEKHKAVFLDERFSVKTIIPPTGKDWNDCLLSGVTKQEIETLITGTSAEQPVEDGTSLKAAREGIKYIFTAGDITYRLTGVKELFVSSLRVQVKAEYNNQPHWDGLDLYSSKSRTYYSSKLAEFCGIEAKIIEKHLVMILEYLEDERDKKLAALQGKNEKVELTEEEKTLGMEFLKSPDMFGQVTADMATLGYVGEELNKQLLYLAASSRILDDPVSILIISSSSAGKSYLVDTVKRLMPEEGVVAVTSLSDQALNYIPDGGLLHKFLILGEAVHSDIIDHQVRDMLSEHRLSRLVTTKDEKTGKMVSETLSAECVVALVLSSTRHNINPENASRCFVINADETGEQTKKIHDLQRNKYSLERYHEKKHVIPGIIKKHQAAQRLLKKIPVVNPFGEYLDFPALFVRSRRDNDRFMDLIACVCFLRQYQKEIKTKTDELSGGTIEYIECDLYDYEVAYNIMVNGVLSSTFAELPESTARLYEDIRGLFRETASKANLNPMDISMTQRDIREKIQWAGASTIREALRKLVLFEYLSVTKGGSRGMRNTYKLVTDAPIKRLDCTMIPTVNEIRKKMKSEQKPEKSHNLLY